MVNYNNKVLSIDTSKNDMLITFFCEHNLMDACALDSFYVSLPHTTDGWLINADNPGVYTSNTQIAINKGWYDEITEGDGSGCDLSVSDFENSGLLNVYPNPACQSINIEVDQDMIGCNMQIFDSVGKLVITAEAETQTTKIDISYFKMGVYFLKINDESIRFIVY